MAVIHRQMTTQERRAWCEAARNGASFDRPEMWCHTGDGHAIGLEIWQGVTCPACLAGKPAEVVKTERAHLTAPAFLANPFMQAAGETGELLTMSDGVQWFHPYGGGGPSLICDENRDRLEVFK